MHLIFTLTEWQTVEMCLSRVVLSEIMKPRVQKVKVMIVERKNNFHFSHFEHVVQYVKQLLFLWSIFKNQK